MNSIKLPKNISEILTEESIRDTGKLDLSQEDREYIYGILDEFDNLDITIRDDSDITPKWVFENLIDKVYGKSTYIRNLLDDMYDEKGVSLGQRVYSNPLYMGLLMQDGTYKHFIYLGDEFDRDFSSYRLYFLHELRHGFHSYKFGFRTDTKITDLEEEIRNVEQDRKIYERLGISQFEIEFREKNLKEMREELKRLKSEAAKESNVQQIESIRNNRSQL